ncbi:hypothetical protein [Paraglaciecola sp. L3A3]|uniref:hypothetical protein n=1 Tax=Paraglaciecola sp. L3A3 TaxID=2686358 RepID=UPI00131BE477|nr:hypothetical protein [Paraglaciecola sp. L3A3]
MPKLLIQICLIICIMLLSSEKSLAKEQPLKISIAIFENILSVFQDWTRNKPCWEVTEFKAEHTNRGAAELIILCKALHLGGLKFEFDIYPTPNYSRSLLLSQQKKVHLQAQTVWLDQTDTERFYVSPALLKKGEIVKGIYTLKNHSIMQYVQKPEELSYFRGVTMPSWHHDWNTIRQLTKNVIAAPSPDSIHKMIEKDRADFTLGEFNQNMSILLGDVYLYPVPNMKIVINQSRHIAVRKDMAHSFEISQAINKGLLKMRASGIINKIYNQTGSRNPEIIDWKLYLLQ